MPWSNKLTLMVKMPVPDRCQYTSLKRNKLCCLYLFAERRPEIVHEPKTPVGIQEKALGQGMVLQFNTFNYVMVLQ